MSAVARNPIQESTLRRHGAHDSKKVVDKRRCLKCTVRKVPMKAELDSQVG
jgi:hypothetical protein